MPPPPPPPWFYLLHMVFDMVPGKVGGEKERVWAEEQARIPSVLKSDSELQDPGRQKAETEGEGRTQALFLL